MLGVLIDRPIAGWARSRYAEQRHRRHPDVDRLPPEVRHAL